VDGSNDAELYGGRLACVDPSYDIRQVVVLFATWRCLHSQNNVLHNSLVGDIGYWAERLHAGGRLVDTRYVLLYRPSREPCSSIPHHSTAVMYQASKLPNSDLVATKGHSGSPLSVVRRPVFPSKRRELERFGQGLSDVRDQKPGRTLVVLLNENLFCGSRHFELRMTALDEAVLERLSPVAATRRWI
jgi:hypothetical protein